MSAHNLWYYTVPCFKENKRYYISKNVHNFLYQFYCLTIFELCVVLCFMVDGNVIFCQDVHFSADFFIYLFLVQQCGTANENAYILHIYNLIPFFCFPLWFIAA